jgi:D-psicose/D-tagatose/L-ribulose 3-epimerase
MYDTFHANIEEADPIGAYARNVRIFGHIHISENDRGVPGRGTYRGRKRSARSARAATMTG